MPRGTDADGQSDAGGQSDAACLTSISSGSSDLDSEIETDPKREHGDQPTNQPTAGCFFNVFIKKANSILDGQMHILFL